MGSGYFKASIGLQALCIQLQTIHECHLNELQTVPNQLNLTSKNLRSTHSFLELSLNGNHAEQLDELPQPLLAIDLSIKWLFHANRSAKKQIFSIFC